MMTLSPRQRIAMSLAGTVSIPSPFPALGQLFLVCDGDYLRRCLGSAKLARDELRELLACCQLKVLHEVSPKLAIARLVRLKDVAALFLTNDSAEARLDRGQWITSPPMIEGLAATCVGERAGSIPEHDACVELELCRARGIAFLPETAPVLMQVEVGLTAAESVEYYPPQPGEAVQPFPQVTFCDEGGLPLCYSDPTFATWCDKGPKR